MNLFSMDDPEYTKSKYFDSVFQKRTYFNLLYSIISMPFLLVCFIFILTTFVTGALFVVFWIGVPLLNLGFITINSIAKTDIKLTNFFSENYVTLPDTPDLNYNSQLKIFLSFINSSNNWRATAYFFCRFLLSIVHFVVFCILVSMTAIMIITPVNAMFGHIRIFNFTTDLFIEAIFIFFIAIVLWIGIVNLINFWMKITEKTGSFFFKESI